VFHSVVSRRSDTKPLLRGKICLCHVLAKNHFKKVLWGSGVEQKKNLHARHLCGLPWLSLEN
jgi:hypothetical protein